MKLYFIFVLSPPPKKTVFKMGIFYHGEEMGKNG